jgi:hypothetical protein
MSTYERAPHLVRRARPRPPRGPCRKVVSLADYRPAILERQRMPRDERPRRWPFLLLAFVLLAIAAVLIVVAARM